MRVAALYDIHGNLPALEAVLADLRQTGVDQVVVGGDVVPGPMAREALARLRKLDIPVQFIYGNCEVAVLRQMAGVDPPGVPEAFRPILRWTAQQQVPDYQAFLETWPKTVRIEIHGAGPVLFCHGTPRDEDEDFLGSRRNRVCYRPSKAPYDYTQAAERIRATAYPQAQEFAAHHVLEPPAEEQMLEVLTRASGNQRATA